MRLTNPFPGHNPFIEQRWGDFQTAMINEIRNEMQYALPAALRARVEETAVVEEVGARKVFTWPDVRVSENPRRPQPGGGGGLAVAEPPPAQVQDDELDRPTLLEREPDARVERHIVVRDKTTGGRIISAIELVSPWNKRGKKGRRRYVDRQSERLDAGINIVEIDLIRGGRAVTLVRHSNPAGHVRRRHHVCAWTAARPNWTAYWGVEITRRLPVITIPLRPEDEPLRLALQPVYDRCYESGRYDDVDPSAPLHPEPTEPERAVIEAALQGRARPAASP